MPTKTIKITTKSESNTSKSLDKKSASKISEKKTIEKKETTRKVVVKRRKTELKPTKASAVAIVSQANRAKKKALIEKVSNSKVVVNDKVEKSDWKIPLWVRIFFGCSLLLFCISFYQAIIRPQLETQIIEPSFNEEVHWSINDEGNFVWEVSLSNINGENQTSPMEDVSQNEMTGNPSNEEKLIQTFFDYMSNWMFDESFNLFDTTAQRDKNIRQYFSKSKMIPFFQWIEWQSIKPQNIQKTTDTYRWKDVYTFDISYALASTHEQFDETWEFVAGDNGWEWKIFRIYCISSQCSKHPIFRPENFGLMK